MRAADDPLKTVRSSPSNSSAASSSRGTTALAIAALALLWLVLCRHLSNEWSANEQYSYGWFVPFFAAYLFWLRWEDRPATETDHGRPFPLTFAFLLFSLLLPLRLFEVGNPDWRPLGWLHAAVVVGLTLLLVRQKGGAPWLKHFAFPICFIFVAVPWVTPVEAPIVQGLMQTVAAVASEMANLCGIPAQLEGSVIRISTGVVGVNEACSGVRSLQTSLMIGLLFGELKRLNLSRRIVLVLLATGVAFIANCARAFFLVWVAATKNLAAVGEWHDIAGYAIVALVFVATIAVASFLAKAQSERKTEEVVRPNPSDEISRFPFRLSTSYFLLPLLWLFAVELAVEFWYRSHERNLITTPTWNVTWPETAPGFREMKINDDVRSTLRFDRGREATWRSAPEITEPQRMSATFFMFFFRWEPGATSILRARAHRPDVCMPNTGWRVLQDKGVRLYPVAQTFSMPFRHFVFARPETEKREISAHAFFCQREDRVPREEVQRFNMTGAAMGNWSRFDRLRVVREGLRNQGQQVLQLVMIAPQALDANTAEEEFAQLVPQIVK